MCPIWTRPAPRPGHVKSPIAAGIGRRRSAPDPVRRSRREQLWDRLAGGDLRNVAFAEFRRPVARFGLRLRRVSGSHYIYTHPQVPRPLSLQPRNREAKPYQISQFLDMVREFALTLEH